MANKLIDKKIKSVVLSPKVVEKKKQTQKYLMQQLENALSLIKQNATMAAVEMAEKACEKARKMWPRFEQSVLFNEDSVDTTQSALNLK